MLCGCKALRLKEMLRNYPEISFLEQNFWSISDNFFQSAICAADDSYPIVNCQKVYSLLNLTINPFGRCAELYIVAKGFIKWLTFGFTQRTQRAKGRKVLRAQELLRNWQRPQRKAAAQLACRRLGYLLRSWQRTLHVRLLLSFGVASSRR